MVAINCIRVLSMWRDGDQSIRFVQFGIESMQLAFIFDEHAAIAYRIHGQCSATNDCLRLWKHILCARSLQKGIIYL